MRSPLRLNLVGLTISGLFILSLLISYRFTSSNFTTEYFKPHEGVPNSRNAQGVRYNNYYKFRYHEIGNDITSSQNLSVLIEDVLNYQREKIAEEMLYFDFPAGKSNVKVEKLSDLTPETGGTPFRSVIFTTWRSGSTFLGDILNAMPGNFYHYEPLLHYDIVQVRENSKLAEPALEHLRKLLLCNYTGMDEYLNYGKEHFNLFTHNTRLWKHCKLFTNYCFSPKFLEPFCKLFPLQSMKTVRLRAALAPVLLDDLSLNVKIILLVRDPRGTMQSRRHRDWCPGNSDCDDPALLCDDMVSDYNAALNLTKKYPQQFKVVRYEDLSLNAYDFTQTLLEFYGLPFDNQVQEFLDSHTKQNIGGVSSTFRNSKSAPFHWAKDLSIEDVRVIQEKCTNAMSLWGYKIVESEDELRDNFNPLLDFKFS